MKTALKIAGKNMRHQLLATGLTMLLVALGAGLAATIWQVAAQADENFRRGASGTTNLVVGPKGSPLQLVLNAVYHLDQPVGNLPYSYFEKLKADSAVTLAIPLALGDNYRGMRLVGTSPEIFSEFAYDTGRRFSFRAGRPFAAEFEAVLGAAAARECRLGIGDEFVAVHGFRPREGHSGHREDHPYRVVGILAATGTPHDRVIYCSLDSVYLIHDLPGAPDHGAEPEHEDEADVAAPRRHGGLVRGELPLAAVLVKLARPTLIGAFARDINNGLEAQAVAPGNEAIKIGRMLGAANRTLSGLASLVLLAAGIAILVSIYNAMERRQPEIAILRAIGAGADLVFLSVILEAVLIAGIGAAAGVAAGHLVLGLAGPSLTLEYGLALGWAWPLAGEWLLLPGAVLLGALAGLVPAARAYRTEVARHLA